MKMEEQATDERGGRGMRKKGKMKVEYRKMGKKIRGIMRGRR